MRYLISFIFQTILIALHHCKTRKTLAVPKSALNPYQCGIAQCQGIFKVRLCQHEGDGLQTSSKYESMHFTVSKLQRGHPVIEKSTWGHYLHLDSHLILKYSPVELFTILVLSFPQNFE